LANVPLGQLVEIQKKMGMKAFKENYARREIPHKDEKAPQVEKPSKVERKPIPKRTNKNRQVVHVEREDIA
jgi:hypothetical protein